MEFVLVMRGMVVRGGMLFIVFLRARKGRFGAIVVRGRNGGLGDLLEGCPCCGRVGFGELGAVWGGVGEEVGAGEGSGAAFPGFAMEDCDSIRRSFEPVADFSCRERENC